MEQLLGKPFNTKQELMENIQSIAFEGGYACVFGNTSARGITVRCVHGHTYKNSHKNTLATRKKKRLPLQADNCPWKLTASCAKKTNLKWKVNKIDDGHNHDLAEDPLCCHQHRRLPKETEDMARAMLEAGARPATVLQATTVRDGQRLVTKRDLYNLRAKLDQGPKNCVANLVTFLHSNNYIVLYDVDEERNAFLLP
ncbi:hypothetical protein VTP01DRAFT_687 [Rhizomucor pusillus]|uniref:uncharacterized protein n=1 Tax=Rhizomucor pusillus TaxID=4840 RepID=UPI003742B5AE